MKAVILAGGLGTRLAEETQIRPKPMVEIGGMPILWHIMKNYAEFGITEFVVCLGYKGFVIKEFFANYFLHMSDVTFELNNNKRVFHGSRSENWKVTLVETGELSQTGRRLRLVREYLNDEEDFCFTYGDGLTNSDISDSINFHRANGRIATLTAVTPKSRYGAVISLAGEVQAFSEKPEQMEGKVNGGFFVLNKGIFEYLQSENPSFEADVLTKLARDKQLSSFEHSGFWQSMDTLRDREVLEDLWKTGNAPWKNWN